MANGLGKGSSVPAKIMAGLTLFVLLGLGLCGVSGVVGQHSDNGQVILFGLGAFCFWGGLILLIFFGIGWAIFAIAKSSFGKKD